MAAITSALQGSCQLFKSQVGVAEVLVPTLADMSLIPHAHKLGVCCSALLARRPGG